MTFSKIAQYVLFVIVVPVATVLLVPKSATRVPLLLMLLAIPLVLGLVPRNLFFGTRTRYALSSDERWHRQNVAAGAAMLVGSIVWLLLILLR